ncbi:TlpA family protein disulfide reductase [Elusimicrobiota bacterium]
MKLMRIKSRIAAAIIVFAFTACMSQDNMSERTGTAKSASNTAYDFNLKDIDTGESVKLSNFSGTPVFLDFWATWCPPCRQAMPYVEKLHEEMGDSIQVIGINLDRSQSKAVQFLESKSPGYMQLTASGSDVSSKYRVSGIPAFFIIDTNGKIAKSYVGFSPHQYDEWVSILEGLVE